MKTEHYNRLVEVVGKQKADKIKDAMLEAELRKKDEEIKEAKRLIRMVDIMIPKESLIDGAYYNGHRWRAGHVAKWDAKKGLFLCINFTMGEFYLEDLPYFADVAETRLDGFLPFKVIEKIEIE